MHLIIQKVKIYVVQKF